jgi:hypothetical protein
MSTVRFSKVIEACGKPDIHLLLIQPAKDKSLQAAIKSDRVMTLYQESGGTDHGVVGFEEGRSRQFLVFPKPLKAFLGQRIVGIKYELLEDESVQKKEPLKKETAKEEQKQEAEPKSKGKNREQPSRADHEVPTIVPKTNQVKPKEPATIERETEATETSKSPSPDKVVKFEKPETRPGLLAESEEVKALKRQVREAMDALEQGKQIVAFNLLKRIVDADR